ncbi:adhesion G protein-coupled receptor E1-like [Diceros bicornis minor]|nr:adhesion G protein-coupled receptor E1-like [Diceros bicornis minor]
MRFRGPGETCENVNECASSTICPAYATCTNTLDSYYCTCKQGFLSSTGETQFMGPGVECKVVPFKCKEDMLPNNEQVQLCQEGAAVEPEYSECKLLRADVMAP